jgi:hypothetical protein
MPEHRIRGIGFGLAQSFGVKTMGVVIGAFSVVVSFMWRDAIRGYIDKRFPVKDTQSRAYLVSALILTIMLVVVSFVNDKYLASKMKELDDKIIQLATLKPQKMV